MNDSVQLFDKKLSIVTKPIPKLSNPTDVLVKVSYSGVCGTDLHILAGEFPSSSKAVTLGHEFCGIVEGVGNEVTHVKLGDRVAVNPNNNCHVCRHCVDGNPHFCNSGGIRSTVGIWRNGGWANFCRVPSVLVHKIDDSVPLKNAVFVEPFSCIARGWDNLGEVKLNSKVLVCGAGIIGLLWSSLLHFKGLRDIAISEIADKRRILAEKMNLSFKIVHPDQLEEQARAAKRYGNEDWGFDIIVDCTGAPKAIQQAFKWTRRGAKFLLFGCCPQEGEITINPFDVYNKELKLIGSLINPFTFFPAMALVRDMEKYLDYKKLGVKTFQLQDYPAALESLKKGLISKAVFNLEESDE